MPAAGQGLRMASDERKQFIELGGKPILIHSLTALASRPAIETIIIVAPEECRREVIKMVGAHGVGKVAGVVPGGTTRQESVANGLAALDSGCDYVLIHDGVRPLVDGPTIDRVMKAGREYGAATAGLPAKDTLAQVHKGLVQSLPERSKMWHIQTPQAFWRPLLEEAQQQAAEDGHQGTDEAGLVVRLGRDVRIVDGSPLNLKITTGHDLRIAQAIMSGPVK